MTSGSKKAKYVRTPTIGLLDLTTFEYRQISRAVDIQEALQPCANQEAMRSAIIDAACSPEPNQPALLVVTPAPDQCAVCEDHENGPWLPCSESDSFYIGHIELSVWPDPIERPNLQGQRLGPAEEGLYDYRPIRNPQESNSSLSITSIDVLDWTGNQSLGNYAFRALATDVQRVSSWCLANTGCDGEACGNDNDCKGLCVNGTCDWNRSRSWRFNIRRLRGNSNSTVTVYNRLTYVNQSSIWTETEPNHHRIKGLSLYGNDNSMILKWASQWRVYHHDTNPAATTHYTDYWYQAETDVNNSPYRSRVSPAHWKHTSGSPAEGRLNFIYGKSDGTTKARRGDNGNTQNLGSNGPTVAAERASFFEVGVDDTYWVDSEDTRTIYQSDVYGQNGQTFRYAVDTSKGIFPFMEGGGADEPFVIYHTDELTQGVVIVTKDQAGCAE